jgi:hypothetical protein
MGNRLYVIGGQVSAASREVIYLDLSKSFTNSSPSWVDYTQTSPLPILISWGRDKDNKTIYVYGGIIKDINSGNNIIDKQIYVFDDSTCCDWDLYTNSKKGNESRNG